MQHRRSEIAVGVLGQWASGKSTAAETLVEYLGGEDVVTFLTDRSLLAQQALDHILASDSSQVTYAIDDRGRQRFKGELATVTIGPGESLETVEPNLLLFDLHDAIFDRVPPGMLSWMDIARLELGRSICESLLEAKPVVIEAGFGTNTKPKGANPLQHTLNDLFESLDKVGVGARRVKWIIVEASFERRAERNRRRKDTVPAVEFNRFAADGGDLAPGEQERWEARGVSFARVRNDHNDVERFRSDILFAFDTLFKRELATLRKGDWRQV